MVWQRSLITRRVTNSGWFEVLDVEVLLLFRLGSDNTDGLTAATGLAKVVTLWVACESPNLSPF